MANYQELKRYIQDVETDVARLFDRLDTWLKAVEKELAAIEAQDGEESRTDCKRCFD